MAQFSDETYEALKALESNAAFRRLVEGLVDKLVEIREQNDTLEGIPLFRSQGKAQILRHLIEASNTADIAVTRMKKNLEGKGPSVSAIT